MCDHGHNLFWGAINDFLMSKTFVHYPSPHPPAAPPPSRLFLFASLFRNPPSLSQGMYFLNGQLLWKVRLQFSCGFSSVLCHGEKISDLLTLYPSPHKMVKHIQTTRRQKPGNCLSVFDHFALKGLKAKYRALETQNKNAVITTSRL